MVKQEKIKEYLVADILKNTGVQVNDYNANLMSIINPLDFLYTLINLEHDYCVNLEALFKEKDHNFLSINQFSDAVAEQIGLTRVSPHS